MRLGGFTVTFVVMIMFLAFVGIPTGTTDTLKLFGINIDAVNGELISADGEQSEFFRQLLGENLGALIAFTLAGAVIVGLFAASRDTIFIVTPVIVFLATSLSSVSWNIIKYTIGFGQAWATNIIVIIFVGIWIAFIMSCMDYFAGR